MARRHPILRGLLISAGVTLALTVLVAGLATVVGGGLGERLSFGKSVGLLELSGVITDSAEAIDALDRFRKQEKTVAVVLRIDSPGGAVAPSQELYDAVWRVRETKPVIASLGNVAASGGYYVASAANTIFADPGTITGSIGAIMSVRQVSELAQKIGVSEQVVKSGRFKDAGNPLRALSPEERAVFQEMVDDVLTQFVIAVAKGRGMTEADVRPLADGRIYSGAAAHRVGLVDRLGGLTQAIETAWRDAGQEGEPSVTRVRGKRRSWWLDLLGQAFLPESAGVAGGLFYLYQGPVLE
jgi:protease IV